MTTILFIGGPADGRVQTFKREYMHGDIVELMKQPMLRAGERVTTRDLFVEKTAYRVVTFGSLFGKPRRVVAVPVAEANDPSDGADFAIDRLLEAYSDRGRG